MVFEQLKVKLCIAYHILTDRS